VCCTKPGTLSGAKVISCSVRFDGARVEWSGSSFQTYMQTFLGVRKGPPLARVLYVRLDTSGFRRCLARPEAFEDVRHEAGF
jgi:hypothetical protein